MKKSLFSLVMLLLGLAALSASAETRTLTIKQPFTELDASAGVKIIYQPSNASPATVKITGDADRVANLDVRVSGKTLKISPKRDAMGNRQGSRIKGVVVTLNAPMLNSIDVSSGASVTCNATMSLPNGKLDLEASSGADIKLAAVNCRSLEAESSSGADIIVKNIKADKTEAEASSGASINFISLSTQAIDCEVSSGASIKLAGNATKGTFDASSGGSIKGSSLTVRTSKIKKSSGGSVRVNTKE